MIKQLIYIKINTLNNSGVPNKIYFGYFLEGGEKFNGPLRTLKKNILK